MYNDLKRIAFNNENFGLPHLGIKYPNLENPRNLFER
jgi:hypothetical protein